MEELVVRIAVFVLVGLISRFLSGLFGIGGGAIRIPIFVYLLPLVGVPHARLMHVCIGTSMALILPSALTATYQHHKLGNLDLGYLRTWTVGLLGGAALGTLLVSHASTELLQVIFTVFLFWSGFRAIFGHDGRVIAQGPPRGAVKLGVSGGIGALAALTGTAGGIFTTVVLKAFNVPLKRAMAIGASNGLTVGAVGTLGAIIAGWQAPGLPAHALGYVDPTVWVGMAPAILIGAPLGVRLGNTLSPTWLKRLYTVLLLSLAFDMAFKLLAGSGLLERFWNLS